jgi:hypothetical protein
LVERNVTKVCFVNVPTANVGHNYKLAVGFTFVEDTESRHREEGFVVRLVLQQPLTRPRASNIQVSEGSSSLKPQRAVETCNRVPKQRCFVDAVRASHVVFESLRVICALLWVHKCFGFQRRAKGTQATRDGPNRSRKFSRVGGGQAKSFVNVNGLHPMPHQPIQLAVAVGLGGERRGYIGAAKLNGIMEQGHSLVDLRPKAVGRPTLKLYRTPAARVNLT